MFRLFDVLFRIYLEFLNVLLLELNYLIYFLLKKRLRLHYVRFWNIPTADEFYYLVHLMIV
jgi:hypothetical protein